MVLMGPSRFHKKGGWGSAESLSENLGVPSRPILETILDGAIRHNITRYCAETPNGDHFQQVAIWSPPKNKTV